MPDLTPVTADFAVIVANIGAVMGDLTPVTADFPVIAACAPNAGLGVLHRAHIGNVTRSGAPILAEVAAALTRVFYYGLGVYDGLNGYDCRGGYD